MRYRRLSGGGAIAALAMVLCGSAHAVMGGPTILSRVDTDGDKTLSLAEVKSAAAKRYELIRSRNGGHVTMLQLGGRLLPADLKSIGLAPSVSTSVSEDDYLALAGKFFDEADLHRKAGDPPGSGTLDLDELNSTAGKKLVGLLQ